MYRDGVWYEVESVRASYYEARTGVRWPGSNCADVRRLGRGRYEWRVAHEGRDEHLIEQGEATTRRDAERAARAALRRCAPMIRATRAADRWIAGAGSVDEMLTTPGALAAAGY